MNSLQESHLEDERRLRVQADGEFRGILNWATSELVREGGDGCGICEEILS